MKKYLCRLKENKGNMSKEFLEIPTDLTLGKYMPSMFHKSKNNFSNILACDSTRVKLQDYEHDYINANYILGSYIATQQPKGSTINDFWKMIYQTNSCLIVNLCGNNNYLPLKGFDKYGSELYGEIFVTFKEIKKNDRIVIRHVILNMVDGDTKELYHVTYLEWPDHGVPDEDEFLKSFDEFSFMDCFSTTGLKSGPMVVHCRAGVGRTGTFIMIHYILKMVNFGKYIDPIAVVKEMRKARGEMIQGQCQFDFAVNVIIKKVSLKIGKTKKLNASCGNVLASVFQIAEVKRNKMTSSSNEILTE